MRKLITISMTILIVLTLGITVFTTVSLSSQEVALTFLPAPKIDIVLAKSKTSTDVTNFKEDMLTQLAAQGIDTRLVNITSVETQNVNMATDFKWEQDVSPSIGSIDIANDGRNVVMVGNYSNPGKNAIWIIPEENQEQEFTFSYNIDYGDSFNAAGMLLRVEKVNNNTLRGYMLSFNNTSGSNWYSAAGGRYGAIWEFTYVIGQNNVNMTKTLKQGININKSGTLNVKTTDSEITISGGGISSPITYRMANSYGNGYGFFSDHYSHGCSMYGKFTLTNINLTTTKVRTFSEVLREPNWRDNAIKVLVNVSDVVNEELDSTSAQGELLTRLINEDINFVGWGNGNNQQQFENLIHSNNNNGKFIANSNYSDSILETAKYIKTLIDELENNSNYLLLNEDIEVVSSPEGILTNTADENYPYGKWKINHDFLYYENNVGQFANTRKYINDMVTKFDKTGKYEITYEDREISPQEIYVHRRPTALIKSERSGNAISLTSNSYDLDSYSTGNKGIQEEEWSYKRTSEEDWTPGKLESITEDSDYVVQLRVKDYQNTWSKPITIYQTGRIDALPIASFGIKNNEITRYENLEIIDTSYDPYGGQITSYTWTVFKGNEQIYTGNTPLTTYTDVGDYTMQLTVTNDRSLTSETYSRPFKIIEDSIPPEVVATPEESNWEQSVTVHLEFSDLGGSQFKQYQYAITKTQETPSEWSEPITNSVDDIKIDTEGTNYLHIIAQDNAGNISEDRVLGEYLIDHSDPIINVTGDFTNITIDKIEANIEATDQWSGIAELNINGQSINNGSITFIKNGTYTIYAEDKVGRSVTRVLNIKNIYYECTAGLEHPIYSSTYDSCPICEEFKGLSVTEEKHIYNSEKQGVKYDNPSKATIVEYYNSKVENPENVGSYNYELKVVYENEEYKTGLTGIYTISPKEITITDLVVPNKVYDGTQNAPIQGGRLVGVYEDDIVQFSLPYMGKADSKDVGQHNITLEEIVLTEEDAPNYILIQPEYGSLKIEITQKDLYIINLSGKTKKYDRDTTIEIIGGELEGNVEGDDVYPIIPPTGESHSAEVGIWQVDLDLITIEGKDAKNYNFIQPLTEDIQVEIIKPDDPLMKVTAEVDSINDNIVEEDASVRYKDTVKMKIRVDNKGTGDGYVSKVIVQLPDGIEFVEEAAINQEFQWREGENGEISTTIYSIENDIMNELPGMTDEKEEGTQGETDEDGKTDSEKAPLETNVILEENETTNEQISNKNVSSRSVQNHVEELDNIVEDMGETESNEENQEPDGTQSFKELELLVNIIRTDKSTEDLISNITIEQQNKLGEVIPYTEGNQENSITQVIMPYKFFDASIDKKIDMLTLTYADSKEEETFDIYQHKDEILKVDLSNDRVSTSIATIRYMITVKNEGNDVGTIDKITDILPEGVKFNSEKNSEWKQEDDTTIVYEDVITLQPGEVKKIPITIEWDLRNDNIGAKDNQVYLEAEKDMDYIIMTLNHSTLEESNNNSHAEILITIPTGANIIIYSSLALISLTILGVGIYFIKKKVIN